MTEMLLQRWEAFNILMRKGHNSLLVSSSVLTEFPRITAICFNEVSIFQYADSTGALLSERNLREY